MKKLTKKEMKNNLGLTKDEIELVWEFQETFTQFWDNEGEGFCIDSRIMWEQLDKPQGEFNKWSKRKILDKNYTSDKDYRLIDRIVEQVSGSKHLKEYILTLTCAKKILMRENTDKGDKVCDYFILMERIVHNYEKWKMIREDEKKGYNILKNALEEKAKRENRRLTMTDYCEEANLINVSLFGYSSWELKNWCNKDTTIRDSFSIEENTYIDELQKADIMLMDMGFDFKTRRDKLKEMVINKGWDKVKIPYDDIVEKLANGGNK